MNEMPPEVCRRKCFLINLAYCCAIAGLVLFVVRYALSALTPFLIAAVAAAVLRPMVAFLHERLHLPRKATGVALTVVLFLLMAFLGLILFDRVIDAATAFLRAVPGLWSGKLMPALDTVDGLDKAADALAQAAAEQRFLSKDDLRQRAKISKTVTETLDRLGIIREIPESDQISFFDLGGGA